MRKRLLMLMTCTSLAATALLPPPPRRAKCPGGAAHRKFQCTPFSVGDGLRSSVSGDGGTKTNEVIDDSNQNSHATEIYSRLRVASLAMTKYHDTAKHRKEVELAEQALMRWLEEYRGRVDNSGQQDPPDAQIFVDVIEGLLALPSPFSIVTDEDEVKDVKEIGDHRRALLGKGLSRDCKITSSIHRGERAMRMLDFMESLHEPTVGLYDTIIATHGADALQCLSYLAMDHRERNSGDETSYRDSTYHHHALKSSKSALQLLDRSEDLYHETGQFSVRLPSVSSYVTVMDVWKALAVRAEEDGDKKKRDEALEVVRNLRERRLKVYKLSDMENNDPVECGVFMILPHAVFMMSVEEVLDLACNILRENVPSYELHIEDPSKVGTWHFNQLIFDLAKYPQSFSGPLAQDLLDYMCYMVRKAIPLQRRRGGGISQDIPPNVPKPNVETINSVLKAWMVTPDNPDVARRAEAVLAKLAGWQSEGLIWGVSADTISYNTAINCWKESGIRGAAQRATEILQLMEDDSTEVAPDVISYTTCIGAWADCSSQDPNAGRYAEEILMRMVDRNKDAGSDLSMSPRPTTRCFNAVLLAYANGKHKGSGKRSLELLRFMESLSSEGYTDLSPDTYTFNIVMKALANCGEQGAAQKAHQLLQRMEQSCSKGVTSLKPTLLSYNTILDAFSKEGNAREAEHLLEAMRSKGDGMVKPNAYSYTAVLSAWMRNDDKAMAIWRAEELFNDIERRYADGDSDFRADTSVYNALINCWAKSGERKALYRVTQILSLMEELGLQGGDIDVAPNARTYCTVLDTLARSKNYKAYSKSLEILQRMEAFYSEGYNVRPCARAYSIVIQTIARSRRRNKALKAQELLHRMEAEYRAGNRSCRPNVFSYNAVLNAAAFSGRDEKEQEEAFKVACLTFDELRMSDYLQPSHVSYGTFLKAIKKLMPESEVRENLVKGLFRKCCRDGLVSDFVLKEVSDLSTPDLYQSLLKGVTNDYGNLPKSWSANV